MAVHQALLTDTDEVVVAAVSDRGATIGRKPAATSAGASACRAAR